MSTPFRESVLRQQHNGHDKDIRGNGATKKRQ